MCSDGIWEGEEGWGSNMAIVWFLSMVRVPCNITTLPPFLYFLTRDENTAHTQEQRLREDE